MLVDQTPIGRTPRSNPVTYLKAFDPIREIFAATKDAKSRGLTASHFSFNVPGGRCEACQGEGEVRVEMQFLADVFVPCDQCDGRRFKPQVLEVKYRGKNINQVLDLTVREALTFFSTSPKVLRRLQVLDEIGLGYLRLGQPATTLSGGEAQRIKIASHLSSRTGDRILYVLDEPTTGLHFDDIAKLLTAFKKLLEAGPHAGRHRAQPRCPEDRGLHHRSRTRRRARGRQGRGDRHARADRQGARFAHGRISRARSRSRAVTCVCAGINEQGLGDRRGSGSVIGVSLAGVAGAGDAALAGPSAAQQYTFEEVASGLKHQDAATRLRAIQILKDADYAEAAGADCGGARGFGRSRAACGDRCRALAVHDARRFRAARKSGSSWR